jgi:WD40 repeat protein
VRAASFSTDGKSMVTVCDDGAARVWDTVTGKLRLPELRQTKPVLSAEFSPRGDWIATASSDAKTCLWDAVTGQQVHSIASPAPLRRTIFSRNGRLLATVCASRNGGEDIAQLWDIAATAHEPRLLGQMIHAGIVWDIAFSPNDDKVATACSDGACRIWDASTGHPLSPPLWHPSSVRQVIFSPNGQIASASEDGTVQLWDAMTGELMAPPFYNGTHHDLIRINFSHDGQRLLIARARDVVWVCDLARTSKRSMEELRLEAQVLSAHRIDPVAGQVPLDSATLSNAWQNLRALRNADGQGGNHGWTRTNAH